MICGREILGDTIYLATDKVSGEKKHLCYNCANWPDTCFVCGLPAINESVDLSDGRVLCARDAKNAVIDPNEAKQVSGEVLENLDKLFSRFTAFPTNIEVAVVDRISLLALFKVPGNDFECPNILGYFRVTTNHAHIKHEISLMSALTRPELKETCAHEYAHAWVSENVSEARRQVIARDAEEGFCELTGYLLMDSQGEEAQKRAVLRNEYTHGQIHLFIEAEKRYGFNEVIEWMKYGVDARLDRANLNRLRNVAIPSVARSSKSEIYFAVPPASPGPEKLMLKGIAWSKSQPIALINNQSFAVGESGKVRLGQTNVFIRCLAVRKESARIKIMNSGEELELSLASQR